MSPTSYQMHTSLSHAVSQFTDLVVHLPDRDLEREWVWGSYESEGARFAYFRMYELLRELAAKIQVARDAVSLPLTGSQSILAQYLAAYLDLQAVMLGVDPKISETPPKEDEWPLRRIYAHIVGADLGFYVTIKYTLDRHRQGLDPLEEIRDETWLAIAGFDENNLEATMDRPLAGLRSYHRDLHARILNDFGDMSESELEIPSRFWEKEHFSLRFRLHRFDSHMRQHTIQAEKTLQMLGHVPSESQQLLRLINGALAEAEGIMIGIGSTFDNLTSESCVQIEELTQEIMSILNN